MEIGGGERGDPEEEEGWTSFLYSRVMCVMKKRIMVVAKKAASQELGEIMGGNGRSFRSTPATADLLPQLGGFSPSPPPLDPRVFSGACGKIAANAQPVPTQLFPEARKANKIMSWGRGSWVGGWLCLQRKQWQTATAIPCNVGRCTVTRVIVHHQQSRQKKRKMQHAGFSPKRQKL